MILKPIPKEYQHFKYLTFRSKKYGHQHFSLNSEDRTYREDWYEVTGGYNTA